MPAKDSVIKIAAVSDLHYQKNADFSYKNVFGEISEKADVLVIPGDLTGTGLAEEAEGLAADLLACRIPVLGLLGNHDYESGQEREIKNILKDAKILFLDEQVFTLGQAGFAGAKGFCGGFGSYMLSSYGEPAIKEFVKEAIDESLALENNLRVLSTKRNVAVVHYAPITDTIKGEPLEIYPFLGSSRLAEVIDRFNVSAVFHGHAHRGALAGRTAKGAPVYNCSLELLRRKHRQPYVLVEI
ncbi:MAG: metallophosphoesterase [Patescibacteria group bacterium]|nr:metallophosphoesterase [Patescibacteria group bacterium]